MSKADTIAYSGKEGDGENVDATLKKYADKIAEVKGKLGDAKLTAATDDTFVYHFLRGHKFDTGKAATALAATLKWRAENNVDEIRSKAIPLAQEKFPFADKMAAVQPVTWMHKTDKKGRPVSIEFTGHSRPADFAKELTSKQYIEYCLYQFEKQMWFLQEEQKKTGVVMRAIQIMDMNGLGLKHLDTGGLAYVEAATNLYSAHYPDMMAEVFIVNAPWLFNTFWRFASSWMAEDVRNNTHMLDDVAKLQATISKTNLPHHLGGDCKCQGGCVREVDPLAGFTKIDIAGKQPHKIQIDNVEKGSLVSWEYRSSAEIGMGASFLPKGEDAKNKIKLVENMRRRSDLRGIDGGFEAKRDGTLTLGWDNTYENVPKTVWYRLDIKKADQIGSAIVIDTSGPRV